jgi:hypothetical protein
VVGASEGVEGQRQDAKAFARGREFKPSTLTYWAFRLRQAAAEQPTAATPVEPPMRSGTASRVRPGHRRRARGGRRACGRAVSLSDATTSAYHPAFTAQSGQCPSPSPVVSSTPSEAGQVEGKCPTSSTRSPRALGGFRPVAAAGLPAPCRKVAQKTRLREVSHCAALSSAEGGGRTDPPFRGTA